MNVKYITTAYHAGAIHYGSADTLDQSIARCRKATGTKKNLDMSSYRFESELPFAPLDRKATENEADAWFAADLCLHWERCNKFDL